MNELEPQVALLKRFQIDFVIIGGVAVVAHGVVHLTYDLDVCYARTKENIEKLAQALQSVNARLRGAPAGLPFILDAQTIKQGLNFTFATDIGPLDLLGEVAGVGGYAEVAEQAGEIDFFGHQVLIIALDKLIAAKRAAGRPKDLLVIPELEVVLETRTTERQ